MLVMSPLAGAIQTLRTDPKYSTLGAQFLDLDPGEHFHYQQAQALAHASGRISTETANIIYRALGETGAPSNGGWAAGVDTATKYVVTLALERIMSANIERRTGRAPLEIKGPAQRG